MTSIDDVIFNLSRSLSWRYRACGNSYPALAIEIKEAAQAAGAGPKEGNIDRRKLKRICEKKKEEDGSEGWFDVSITVMELVWIDAYLKKFNKGLAEHPIFSRAENLLDAITSTSKHVCFFLGAIYNHTHRSDVVSRYDLKGLEDLMRWPLNELQIELQDVLLEMEMLDSHWKDLCSGKEAMISFGSSVVNSCSEYILADMVGVPAFTNNTNIDLPFHFVFPPRDNSNKNWASTFIFNKPMNNEMESMISEQRTIVVLDEVYVNKEKEREYGILIAQRQKSGHVRIVLFGTHGPSTLSLSRALAQRKILCSLPDVDNDAKHQPILIVIVCASVEFEEKPDWNVKDVRKLLNFRISRPPKLLVYDDKNLQWKWAENHLV